MAKDIKNIKLKDYQIYEEAGSLHLSLVYSYEAEDGEHELYLPKVKLGMYIDKIPNLITECCRNPEVYAEFGSKQFQLLRKKITVSDKFGNTHDIFGLYADCLVKEKKVEMTLEEIEKKLGHKIKIVSDKEDKE